MPAATKRRAAKRAVKRSVKTAERVTATAADFCVRAREALKRGAPDDITTAAVKIYAAKVERRGHDVAPFTPGTVTATETVVTACGMIRAADLNMFDVAIWFHRPQGIE